MAQHSSINCKHDKVPHIVSSFRSGASVKGLSLSHRYMSSPINLSSLLHLISREKRTQPFVNLTYSHLSVMTALYIHIQTAVFKINTWFNSSFLTLSSPSYLSGMFSKSFSLNHSKPEGSWSATFTPWFHTGNQGQTNLWSSTLLEISAFPTLTLEVVVK